MVENNPLKRTFLGTYVHFRNEQASITDTCLSSCSVRESIDSLKLNRETNY